MTRSSKERGRPRDEAVHRSILHATRVVLETDGWNGLSIERVAREAGVGKTSIYRRWPTKIALVMDATLEPLIELEPGAQPSDALRELIDSAGRDFERADFRAALPGLVAECLANPEEMNRRRLGPEIRILASALESAGWASPDLEEDAALLFELYVGAILMRMLRGASMTPAYRLRLHQFLVTGSGLDP